MLRSLVEASQKFHYFWLPALYYFLQRHELYDLLNRPGPLWLANADLSGADLPMANLAGAILRGVDLTGADLSKAEYYRDTLWPAGFHPEAAGAIKAN